MKCPACHRPRVGLEFPFGCAGGGARYRCCACGWAGSLAEINANGPTTVASLANGMLSPGWAVEDQAAWNTPGNVP